MSWWLQVREAEPLRWMSCETETKKHKRAEGGRMGQKMRSGQRKKKYNRTEGEGGREGEEEKKERIKAEKQVLPSREPAC